MRWVTRLGLAIAAATFALPALAQNWPDKPVKIVVPFGPGGPADVYARILGQALTESLGQQFIIDNKPGAGAIIGTDVVAKAAPDGYTLLMMSNTHTTNETLFANKPYQLMRDFVAVAPVNSSDLVMVVHPSVPAKTLQEFIALAKAKPGKLNYASSGPGTPYHMAGELFKAMTGTDILHVPHKGSGEARNDVMGGHVQMMFDAVTTMKGRIEAGKVRALGTTRPASARPCCPTCRRSTKRACRATRRRSGSASWRPRARRRRSSTSSTPRSPRSSPRPRSSDAWAKQGAVPMTMTPAAFGAFLRAGHRQVGQDREDLRRDDPVTHVADPEPAAPRSRWSSVCGRFEQLGFTIDGTFARRRRDARQAAGGRAGRPRDPEPRAGRGAGARAAMSWPRAWPMSRAVATAVAVRSGRSRAGDRRQGGAGGGARGGRRDPLPRSGARDRRHPLRQGDARARRLEPRRRAG